jgi:hypothetical protein
MRSSSLDDTPAQWFWHTAVSGAAGVGSTVSSKKTLTRQPRFAMFSTKMAKASGANSPSPVSDGLPRNTNWFSAEKQNARTKSSMYACTNDSDSDRAT